MTFSRGADGGAGARDDAPPTGGRGPRRPLSVAPMMDWTDRHFRFFLRLISRETLLYSEMISTGAILRGDREHLLGFSQEERPLALQLGGDDPSGLAECARIAEALGYDEINLNAGCPSDRVRRGRFGACLMARPRLVADCVAALRAAVALPVTVKHRLGIAGRDSYDELVDFVGRSADAGCDGFVVHARIAELTRLSPKQNRRVPPLRHDLVYRLKQDFPALRVELNGGVRSPEEAASHLDRVDGVMIGRAACANPYVFASADATIWQDERPPRSRGEVVQAMSPYVSRWVGAGQPAHRITRHMLGLFRGQPGARVWRRYLSEHARHASTGDEAVRVLERALALVREASE